MKQSLLLCMFSLAIAPSVVMAEDLFASGHEEPGQFYAGYSLLNSEAECNYDNVACESIGWKLSGGYKFNDNIAIEGGYYDLFSNDALINSSELSSQNGYLASLIEQDVIAPASQYKSVVNGSGIGLSAIGSYSIDGATSLSGKVGIMAWEAEGSTNGTTTAVMDGTDILTGVGFGYKLNDNWQLRGEYEHVGGDLEANLYSAGATLSTL